MINIILVILMSSFTVLPRPEVINFDELEPRLHQDDNNTYLINFWATWCTPCVEEIPAIEKIGREYGDQNLKVLLVSLDFPSQLENRLIPFIASHNLESEVILLDDPDGNKWIDRVDKSWSGSIPATLIYNKSSRDFYEKAFGYEELKEIIENKIN